MQRDRATARRMAGHAPANDIRGIQACRSAKPRSKRTAGKPRSQRPSARTTTRGRTVRCKHGMRAIAPYNARAAMVHHAVVQAPDDRRMRKTARKRRSREESPGNPDHHAGPVADRPRSPRATPGDDAALQPQDDLGGYKGGRADPAARSAAAANCGGRANAVRSACSTGAPSAPP